MYANAEAAVWTAFAADTLALGPHWIYDTDRIAQAFGRVSAPVAPLPDSYHKTKSRGDFTHYGDQMLVLLESLASQGGFNLADFGARWQDLFKGYTGYVDGATRGTLANFEFGATPKDSGSGSNDLAGASRFAPLLLTCGDTPDALVRDTLAQTKMTHNKTDVLNAAEFFARTAHAVLQGATPSQAMHDAAQLDYPQPIAAWYKAGLQAASEDPVAAISRLGQTCHTPDAFPSCVALITRYESDPAEALIQNVMAGGDSAARGIIVGAVLGASHGPNAVPENWITTMRRADDIQRLMATLAAQE